MAKRTSWTENQLLDRGFRMNPSTGGYEKILNTPMLVTESNGVEVPEALILDPPKVKRGRPRKDELPINDRWEMVGNGIRIIMSGLTPGLNGSDGMMQKHWSGMSKEKRAYTTRLQALRTKKFLGQIKITFIRHTSLYMDWDNACASFKLIGDALQAAEIIVDDSPLWLREFYPKQAKCRRKDQRMEILIEPLGELPL